MSTVDDDTRERLIQASRLATLGRLLGSALHQMSTPLGAIALRAESLAREAEDPAAASLEKRRRYVKAIGEEAQRCQDLVAALRDFASPGEAGGRFDVVQLCRQALVLLRHEAMRRQIALVLEGDQAALVGGQRERVGQALLAPLLNALDASARGGRVRVVVTSDAGTVAVAVEDEGEGVPEDVHLFEAFASSQPPERGLGLGLMASRAVAEAHGGAITYEPAAGRGSRFVLRLPALG